MNENVVGKIKKYVEEHLREPITAAELAKAVGYSRFHMARMFKNETGESPFEYIRRKRLLRSAFALRNEQKKIVDVAFDYMFDSQEGFTRAFSNAFGITPKKYSAFSSSDEWIVPYYYLDRKNSKTEVSKMENKTSVVFTQIVERPARKLILFRSKKASAYFEYCEEVGCGTPEKPAPWDILCGIKDALNEPMGVWLPAKMRLTPDGIYAHAVEVPAERSGEIPNGFDVIDLEPCKYIIFQGEPYDDADFENEVGACMERIEKFNPEIYGYEYDEEIAPRFQFAPNGWRGYIEGRAVRKIV